MGNGPSRRTDHLSKASVRAAAAPPADMESSLAADGDGVLGVGGPSGADADGSFCTRPQLAEFRVAIEIESDTDVRLIIGRTPEVRSAAGDLLGELVGQTAGAMRNCLEMGYTMKGVVETKLLPGEMGQVVVRGDK